MSKKQKTKYRFSLGDFMDLTSFKRMMVAQLNAVMVNAPTEDETTKKFKDHFDAWAASDRTRYGKPIVIAWRTGFYTIRNTVEALSYVQKKVKVMRVKI